MSGNADLYRNILTNLLPRVEKNENLIIST